VVQLLFAVAGRVNLRVRGVYKIYIFYRMYIDKSTGPSAVYQGMVHPGPSRTRLKSLFQKERKGCR